MGSITDITQNKLDRALASEEMASKIKLRRLSHANLIEHVKNIPYVVAKAPKVISNKFHLPSEQMDLNVSPKKYIQLVSGNYKPINVKEDKLENIRSHADILVSMAIGNEQTQNIPIESNVVVDNDVVDQEVVQDIYNVDEGKIVDISEYVAKIENETQILKKIKEEAALAQQEANASDEEVSKLSVEVSELEKQEAEIQKRNDELDKQIMAAYEEQSRIQALSRKEYKYLIEEANARKKNNDDKVIQLNSKREASKDRITIGNEHIAKKQGILAGIQQTEFPDVNNIVQFPTDGVIDFANDSEEKVKRIA